MSKRKTGFNYDKLFHSPPPPKFNVIPIIALLLTITFCLISAKYFIYDPFKSVKYDVPTYLEANLNDTISLDIKVYNVNKELLPFNFKVMCEPLIQIKHMNKFQIVRSGYSKIDLELFGYHKLIYLFVTPIQSKLSINKFDVDYYRTQFNTGLNGNCGAAVLSMAMNWSKNIDVPVRDVRTLIGLPYLDGAIGFYHIEYILKYFHMSYKMQYAKNAQSIFDIIDRGNIAIILFNSRTISINNHSNTNLFGKYYSEFGGHFIIIKGYSLNHKWLIVFDPMPNDWYSNSFRYKDEISMMGKNRYYSVSEIMKSLNRTIVEIK
jgi:hypothetical protein